MKFWEKCRPKRCCLGADFFTLFQTINDAVFAFICKTVSYAQIIDLIQDCSGNFHPIAENVPFSWLGAALGLAGSIVTESAAAYSHCIMNTNHQEEKQKRKEEYMLFQKDLLKLFQHCTLKRKR